MRRLVAAAILAGSLLFCGASLGARQNSAPVDQTQDATAGNSNMRVLLRLRLFHRISVQMWTAPGIGIRYRIASRRIVIGEKSPYWRG